MDALPTVMVLGCGRSGTSILGELFEQLGPYTYLSEPPLNEIMATDFNRPMAFKVPRGSEAFPADPGLSFPLDALLEKMPSLQIYWIVRHPLDTICSLRPGIAKSWGHHPKPPDWQDWLTRPLLERCAHHWDYINSQGFEQVAKLATLVRFEEMIAEPAAVAKAVRRSIHLPKETASAAVAEWSRRVQDSNNEHFVEAKTSRSYSRPDHSVRVGRWRENLSHREAADIWPLVSGTAEKFGYRFPE